MTGVRASAPGKLLLFGEYAVLAGGTAVVMAVDRRAVVTVETFDSEDLHVVAPQLGLTGEGLVFDHEAPERILGMTGRLLADRLERHGLDPVGLRITIDTAALFDDGPDGPVKLGLGSSAAVAAALDTALAGLATHSKPALADLLPAYREAIGGLASGADLAASLGGGLRRVRADGDTLDTLAIDWPAGLRARPIWVGAPASTPRYAAAFGRWREAEPDSSKDWIARMDALTRQTLDVGSAAAWCEAAGRWLDALIELQAAIGAEIVTEPHRRLADLAGDCGIRYKTCGAGGGDFGLALAEDPDALAAFEGRAMALGGRPVELRLETSGARLEPPPIDPAKRTPPGA